MSSSKPFTVRTNVGYVPPQQPSNVNTPQATSQAAALPYKQIFITAYLSNGGTTSKRYIFKKNIFLTKITADSTVPTSTGYLLRFALLDNNTGSFIKQINIHAENDPTGTRIQTKSLDFIPPLRLETDENHDFYFDLPASAVGEHSDILITGFESEN